MKPIVYIGAVVFAVALLAITGYLLAEAGQLSLPFSEGGHGRGGEVAPDDLAGGEGEFASEEERETNDDEGESRGTGRGDGQGQGQGRGLGEGRNERRSDGWSVLANLWVMAAFFVPVIIIDRITNAAKAKKQGVKA